MSNLFGQSAGRTAATTQPKALGIDLQGAQYGPPIPVAYGQNRVPGNVIWYGDFKSVQHTQKVGKGFGGGTSTSWTYSASYLNGLCEGPITGLVQVWSGNSILLLGTLAPFSATGALGQAPWSVLPAPANLGYSLTALFGVDNMALGGSPTLPNYNYEVAALQQYGSGIVDANPSAILTDICTSTTHGVPFNYLGSLTQYSAYCVANSLFLSPVYNQQSTAVQVLTDLFKATNTYAYFSEGVLKVVPLGDVAVTGNGVTYTPNVTPLVNLGAGDFIVSGQGSPVTVQRKAPQDCYNSVSVQFADRSNTYHNSAVVASIDEDMIANGVKMAQTSNINGCVTASVARFIAQNMVQRAYFVRNTYKFKLSWRYCYLEPTDLVTLTDINTGLNLFPVRVLDIAEDAEGLLDITAEEFPEGIGHSAIYGTQPNSGAIIDPLADPGPVNAPYLFRMPGYLVGNASPEIGCAVCGSAPMWGGADIYISYDGTSYQYLGSINAPARYGVTTTQLAPATTDPDTTTTLGVSLYAPAVLLGGTQSDADNLSTLCMVANELLAYETATLTGSEAYNLTYLRRNAYGTALTSTQAGGAPFVRLDDAIFRFPVDPSLIGATVWVKFLSVNVFGRTPRTLASETAYQYVVGSNVELPDVPPTPATFAALAVADGVQLSWVNTVPAAVSSVAIYRSSSPTSGFTLVASVGNTATTWVDHFTNGATWYYYLTARGPLISSGWSANTATISSTGKTVANGATVGATVGSNLYNLGGSLMPQVTTYLGAWSGITAYVLGNEVLNATDGNHYIALAPNTNQQPPNATYWKLLGPQTLDALGDGATYLRMPGANMDVNRRGLIDFTQAGHLGKVLDNIGDGTTYARTLSSGLSGGQIARFGLYEPVQSSRNFLFNPTGALGMNGWTAAGTGSNASAGADPYAGGRFYFSITGNVQSSPILEQLLPPSATNVAPHYRISAIVEIDVLTVGTGQGVGIYLWDSTAGAPLGQQFLTSLGQQSINFATSAPSAAGHSLYLTITAEASACSAYISKIKIETGNAQATAYTDDFGLALVSQTHSGNGAVGQDGLLDGVTYARTVASDMTSNRLDFSKGLLNKQLDNIPDGTTYARVAALDSTPAGGVNRIKLGVAGSGAQLGDKRNLPQSAVNNISSYYSTNSLTWTATLSAGVYTGSINSAAFNAVYDGNTIAYNASTVNLTYTGTGGSVQYWVYFDDPNHAGGTPALVATTTQSDCFASTGRVYMGSVSVLWPSAAGQNTGGFTLSGSKWSRVMMIVN